MDATIRSPTAVAAANARTIVVLLASLVRAIPWANATVLTLLTVTVTALAVVRFPAASRAIAVSVCEPLLVLVVFQETEYGDAVTSAPKFAPSSWNCTPTTPTLSDAAAETVIVPETDVPLLGLVSDTIGGTLSMVTITALEVVLFPAASRTIAVSVCAPSVAVLVLHDTEYGGAVTSAPTFAPSSWN